MPPQIIYLRMLSDRAQTVPAFIALLSETLAMQTEVKLVKPPEPHPKGGFAVWVLASDAALDEWITTVQSRGFQFVI